MWNHLTKVTTHHCSPSKTWRWSSRVDVAPPRRFLLRPVWAEGDYGMIAAEDKAGKTWLCSDIAVSVASGTPALGLFPVESPGPVLMFVGEGGESKFVRRLRAICTAREIDAATLSIRVAMRVPHLTSMAALTLVEEEIAASLPQLVIIDPLYLAARGAKGSDLYEMGANLQGVQVIAQRYGAALLISHHFNKTGEGRGAKRMSGVGPSAWGRVLVSGTVVSRHTDHDTKKTTTVLDLDFQGDEIAESTVRIRRTVWSDDPEQLSSALHYVVEELSPELVESTSPELDGAPPAAKRVFAVLGTADDPLTVKEIGDALAIDGTGLSPLKRRTIAAALDLLSDRDLADSFGEAGSAARWWSTTNSACQPYATPQPGTPEIDEDGENAV